MNGLLAEPPLHSVDGAVMDYFLIEAVNALRTSAAVAAARAKNVEREMAEAGLLPARDSTDNACEPWADGDGDEGVRTRLEAIGVHVGANFAERLCRDRALFADALDAVKFVCKDVWVACWDKQVDNLRTNHRGVFVLQDNALRPVSRMSSWQGRAEAAGRAKLYVAFPAGVIRGALARIGLPGTVSAEITTLPHCTFQIKLPKNGAW